VTDSRFFRCFMRRQPSRLADALRRWHLQSGLIPAFRAIIAVVSQRSGLTAKTPSLDSKTARAARWFIWGVIAQPFAN
jgi:hypothetical protein